VRAKTGDSVNAINSIKVSGLSLSLGGCPILSGVSFDVPPGGLLCVIGRNGAGKSTLFKCVAGIFTHYAGGISIGGRAITELSARERARLVAYVPQGAPGGVPYTAGEFLEMSRYPWRSVSSKARDLRAVASAMELTGTAGLADRRLCSLSGGELQKVMIASAIAQEAGTILMDEPTTYLDYAHQVETMEVISRVNRERGVSVLVVTHDVNLAIRLTCGVAAMSEGRVEWSGPSSELREPELLKRIFGVPFRLYRSEPDGMTMAAPERGI
jgi:iron complex transport system ATP-binding protein